MNPQLTTKSGETYEQITKTNSDPVQPATRVSTRDVRYHDFNRTSYVAGAVVAVLAIVGILVTTIFPTMTTKVQTYIRPVETVTLPPYLTSDMRDFQRATLLIQPAFQLPPYLTNDKGTFQRTILRTQSAVQLPSYLWNDEGNSRSAIRRTQSAFRLPPYWTTERVVSQDATPQSQSALTLPPYLTNSASFPGGMLATPTESAQSRLTRNSDRFWSPWKKQPFPGVLEATKISSDQGGYFE
jgi:hypothetical protein